MHMKFHEYLMSTLMNTLVNTSTEKVKILVNVERVKRSAVSAKSEVARILHNIT